MNTTNIEQFLYQNPNEDFTISIDHGAIGASIFIVILFLIIFCVMFFSVMTYIVTNLVQGNEPLLVHWWDFGTNQGFIIIYMVIYLLYLLDIYKLGVDDKVPKCKDNKLCINLNFLFYVLICIILSNVYYILIM